MNKYLVTDTATLTGRSLRHVLRSPDTIITTAVTPVAMMLLFVYVFGSAIETGQDGDYVDYLLPGILLITVASGVAYTSYRLFLDLQSGIFERFQSLPIARSSVTRSLCGSAVQAGESGTVSRCTLNKRLGSPRLPKNDTAPAP